MKSKSSAHPSTRSKAKVRAQDLDTDTERDSVPLVVASHALANELKEFCVRSNLTPRETQIIEIMVQGVVRIKDVADRLKLSPNTINNHVNSIFVKTQTRSKSSVLSQILSSVAEELQTTRFFKQTPRILVVESDAALARSLSEVLDARGFRVLAVKSRGEAEEKIIQFGPHFVLADLQTLEDARHFMRFICSRYPVQVVFMGMGGGFTLRCEAISEGAIDALAKPVDIDRLLKTLMLQYIENEDDRLRYLILANSPWFNAKEDLMVSKEALGLGGLYIPKAETERIFDSRLSEGDMIELKFSIAEATGSKIAARGMVVWSRGEGDPFPGVGVKFTHVPALDRERLSTFLRANSIQSFIPDRPR